MSKKIISSRLETIFDEMLIPDSLPKGKEEMSGLHPREMVDIFEAAPQPSISITQVTATQAETVSLCAHIGILADEETALSYPSEWNVCHRASPARSPTHEHQRVYCLTGFHESCPFLHRKAHLPLPEYIRM